MKKRIWNKVVSIFTAILLVVGIVPNTTVTALAAGEHDSHSNNWTEFTAGTTTLSGGSYYLSGDVVYSGTEITVSGEVILCLNGAAAQVLPCATAPPAVFSPAVLAAKAAGCMWAAAPLQ